MLIIAIDGACRRNGKADCIAAGGVLALYYDFDTKAAKSTILSNFEVKSTNQRGELLALLTALDYVWEAKMPVQIVTDSEYIYNSMTKEWYKNWSTKGWLTAIGEPVKNKDIWMQVLNAMTRIENEDIEVLFFHIKGHCMPFGKITANALLNQDSTGLALLQAIEKRYDECHDSKIDLLRHAGELSVKNNGFELRPEVLRLFVVTNTVADAVATRCVEAADALIKS